MYKSGIDIRVIQEFLGHTEIDTTSIYLHTYNEDVKNAMLDFPLANFKIKDALAYCA